MNKEYDPQTGIFIGEHNHKFDKSLANAILNLYKDKNIITVADLGCGNGNYVNVFKEFGWEVDGYEGNKLYTDNPVDLSEPLNPDKKYDLIVCLEVGEHIPPERCEIFLDNLEKFSFKHLILSWGIPNQKGKGHVNCLSNETVINHMKKRYFEYINEDSEYLRNNASLSWFKNTIMVFKK